MKSTQIKIQSGIKSGDWLVGTDDLQNVGQQANDNIQIGFQQGSSLGSQVVNAATFWQ